MNSESLTSRRRETGDKRNKKLTLNSALANALPNADPRSVSKRKEMVETLDRLRLLRQPFLVVHPPLRREFQCIRAPERF